MKIGITYNLKEEIFPASVLDSEFAEEFDTIHTVDAICNVFERHGFETLKLGGSIDVIDRLKKDSVDFVFNIAEGYHGRNRESHIPAVLEMLNIPYSGSDPLTLALTLDKTMTKKIAVHARIPTPLYSVLNKMEDLQNIENKLSYPLITKPAWEGSSKGIYNSSKVYDRTELERSVFMLFEKYPDQPVLVEKYIEGREITAGVIGNSPPHILGIMEIVKKGAPGEDFFYSLDVKRDWKRQVDYVSPPDIDRSVECLIKHYAITAFKEFGCRDIARIDFRVARQDGIFMLELNPLPGLSPEYADIAIMSRKLGMGYEELILTILNHALSRYGRVKEDAKEIKKIAPR